MVPARSDERGATSRSLLALTYAGMLICRLVDHDPDPDDHALRALANPNRRRILRLVRDHERSVGDLAVELGMSQPAVSQHLAVLRQSGLVRMTPAGRRHLYRADNAAVAAAGRFFAEYWEEAADRLAATAEALATRAGSADGDTGATDAGVVSPGADPGDDRRVS